MSHSRTRISRALIALLLLMIVLGGIFYLHKRRNTTAAVTSPAPAESTAVAAVAPQPVAPVPAVTQTPETPALSSVASAAPAAETISIAPSEGAASATPSVPATQPASNAVSAAPASLAAAKSQLDAGDLLGARKALNDIVHAGQLSASDLSSAKQILQDVNKTIIFSTRRFADDPFGGTYTVKHGDTLARIAAAHETTPELLGSVNGITDPRRLREGQTLKLVRGPFHAVVYKKQFQIELYLGSPGQDGSMYIMSFPVGLGRDDSTPTGLWMVEPHNKLSNPKFWGAPGLPPREGGDPLNPLGKYWIGLSGTEGHAVGKLGYGIHGTNDPASIGHQESLGCIRLHNEDVAMVFQLLVDGKSTVVVRD